MNEIFRPMWILRIFFPLLFLILFSIEFMRIIQNPYLFESMALFDWVMFGVGFFILYAMIYILTVKYEISNDKIMVHSFIWRKKILRISDINFIEEEGTFAKVQKPFLGPCWTRLHFKNGKKQDIYGLSEHYKFLQIIKSKTSQ